MTDTALSDVRLQFSLPGTSSWVDRDGTPAEQRTTGDVIVLDDADGPAARLVGRTSADLSDAVLALGPMERMALASARESALTRAHAREVVESQRRIVALTDRERRRIEADLHDGAQQRLVTVKLHLALAAAQHPGSSADLASAEGDVQAALSALRDIAHGQVPRILETEGLSVALEDLASSSLVPVDLVGLRRQDDPGPESAVAVYSAVAAVLRQADPSCADPVVVSVSRVGSRLLTEIAVPWRLTATPEVVVAADRFGALGGVLSTAWDGIQSVVRGELPCV